MANGKKPNRPERVISNGASPEWFAQFEPAEKPLPKMIFACARWRRHKRLDQILKVFMKMDDPEVGLWIAGETDATVRHPRVWHLGTLSPSDLAPYYLGADCLLHLSWSEACANVVVEAVNAGLPVLTNNRCSNGELGKFVTGVCSIPVDPKFEYKMQDLRKIPDCTVGLAAEGLREVLRNPPEVKPGILHIDHVAKEYRDLFEKVLCK
jgi:hypothetical protein